MTLDFEPRCMYRYLDIDGVSRWIYIYETTLFHVTGNFNSNKTFFMRTRRWHTVKRSIISMSPNVLRFYIDRGWDDVHTHCSRRFLSALYGDSLFDWRSRKSKCKIDKSQHPLLGTFKKFLCAKKVFENWNNWQKCFFFNSELLFDMTFWNSPSHYGKAFSLIILLSALLLFPFFAILGKNNLIYYVVSRVIT